jgi:two-component system sensor histidine kinase ChvG
MTAGAEAGKTTDRGTTVRTADARVDRVRFGRRFARFGFSTLGRRIVILNVAALIVLVSGILFLNQFRAGLIDSRVQSLLTQGEIIAGAISTAAAINTDAIIVDPDKLLEQQARQNPPPTADRAKNLDFPINPERAAQVLRRLVSPTRTRARIFDREGVLLVDSRNLHGSSQVLSFDPPAPAQTKKFSVSRWWSRAIRWVFSRGLPLQKELGAENGKGYREVVAALSGAAVSVVRVNTKGEMIVSVAVPIQRFRSVLGALVLSTRGGEIDAIVRAERAAIFRLFLVAAAVTALFSFLLAGTIAGPMRRLAQAAESVRRAGTRTRVEIPDYTTRKDEIGHLSGALRDMTDALYNRIAAIESFAADVAHELKNPLTSLRSATETLSLVRDKASRDRLIEIVQQDVRRLDRLISDISDASRLDAELAREEAQKVDLIQLLETVMSVANEMPSKRRIEVKLDIKKAPTGPDAFMILGHDSRLGQVIVNLLDNARSFSPDGGEVRIAARRLASDVEIRIEDDGVGIRPESLDKIFDRFHTDRPEDEQFGENSGLGLSISRQIIEAHGGRIRAENRYATRNGKTRGKGRKILGARFVITLPAAVNQQTGRTGRRSRNPQERDGVRR